MTSLYKQPYKLGASAVIPRANDREIARLSNPILTPRNQVNRAKRVGVRLTAAVTSAYTLPSTINTGQPLNILIIVYNSIIYSAGGSATLSAMSLSNIPAGSRVTLINYATIRGSDGWNTGGKAPTNNPGGNGLIAPANCKIKIYNFGTISAGSAGGGTAGVSAITNYRNVTLCVSGNIVGALTP